MPHAQGHAGLHELAVAHGHELAAHQARHRRPRDHRDGEDHVADRGPQHGHQQDCEQEKGNGLEQFGEAHQQAVQAPAEVTGQAADGNTEDAGDDGGHHAHQQGGAGAVQHAGSQIATQRVGAQRVCARGRLKRLADHAERITRIDRAGKRRSQQHTQQQNQAGHGGTVPEETQPAAFHASTLNIIATRSADRGASRSRPPPDSPRPPGSCR